MANAESIIGNIDMIDNETLLRRGTTSLLKLSTLFGHNKK